jgi:lipoprotein-anchoring transpeptidase ErfK/SrfK
VVVAPSSADSASGVWQTPSPAAGSVLTVEAGKKLTFTLNVAALGIPSASLTVKPHRLPRGAAFRAKPGNPGTAVFSWQPAGTQIGEHAVSFTVAARAAAGVAVPALPLTIKVGAGHDVLTTGNVSRWAYVARPVAVRAAPSRAARAVGRIGRWTPENYPNLVSLLEQRIQANGTWVRIRFPKLPNNTTGWVKRGALGSYRVLNTHVIVSRVATRLTLYRNGAVIFQTRVGVGQPQWPTPRGEFYITEKMTGFSNPAYGPVAFGTSARSAVLTDWPGGGFVGIHGTNAPGLIPGRISHGCIRVRNAAVVRLARLLPIGTPLTIQ